MGSSASKKKQKKHQQKPVTTQIISTTTRSGSADSDASIDTQTQPLRASSKRLSRIAQTPSGRDSLQQNQRRASSGSDAISNGQRIEILPNGTEPSTSSYQDDNSSNDGDDIHPVTTTNNFQRKSKSSSSSVSPETRVDPSRTDTRASKKLVVKARPISPEHANRCSFCPHCQRVPRVVTNKAPSSPPPWIVKTRAVQPHIIMDDYDEEAVRNKIISEQGHLPGSYQYAPNLIMEEKKDQSRTSSRYTTLPSITKPGSTMLPAHTPFPNYDTIQRRERRLNRPYSNQLYAD